MNATWISNYQHIKQSDISVHNCEKWKVKIRIIPCSGNTQGWHDLWSRGRNPW